MENEKLLNEVKYSEWHNEMGKFYKRQNFLLKTLQEDLLELLHPTPTQGGGGGGGVRKCNSADLLR